MDKYYYKLDKGQTIDEVFGPLETRLHSLFRGKSFEYNKVEPSYSYLITHIERHVFNIDKKDVVERISSTLVKISIYVSKIDEFVKDAPDSYFDLLKGRTGPKGIIDKISRNEFKLHLSKELNYYKKNLEELKSNIELSMTLPINSRIKTNLTVPELAYLFRIMEEHKIIKISPGKKAEFYRIISDTFNTKRTDRLSPGSFKNHFENPSDKAIQYWCQKFGELKQKAATDKENYRH